MGFVHRVGILELKQDIDEVAAHISTRKGRTAYCVAIRARELAMLADNDDNVLTRWPLYITFC